MGDLSEATESHLETLKMVMAAQQRLEQAVEREGAGTGHALVEEYRSNTHQKYVKYWSNNGHGSPAAPRAGRRAKTGFGQNV